MLLEFDLSLIAKKSLQAIRDTKREYEDKIATVERHAVEGIAEANERCEQKVQVLQEKIAEVEANCAGDIQNTKEHFKRGLSVLRRLALM